MTEYRSELTAIARKEITRPLRIALQRDLIKKGDRILDYGSGKSIDADYLSTLGLETVKYDKYYYPESPTGTFDVILCIYVLNVVTPEEQKKIVNEMMSVLNPYGIIIIAVRSPEEITREATKHHWSVRFPGYVTSRGTYQVGMDDTVLSLLFKPYPGDVRQIGENTYVFTAG